MWSIADYFRTINSAVTGQINPWNIVSYREITAYNIFS